MSVRLLAFCGSARKDSTNRRLLAAAVKLARAAGAAVTELDLRSDLLPIYDGDLETQQGLPAAALQLKAQFASHDGFHIASPEYNGFFPPLLKNTLDWVSRPAQELCESVSPSTVGGIRQGGVIGARSDSANGEIRHCVIGSTMTASFSTKQSIRRSLHKLVTKRADHCLWILRPVIVNDQGRI